MNTATTTNELLINSFIAHHFASDHDWFAGVLGHYEDYKNRYPDTKVNEEFYANFAALNFPSKKMQVICLLRQYECYLTEKSLVNVS